MARIELVRPVGDFRRLVRYQLRPDNPETRIGIWKEDKVFDLTDEGVQDWTAFLETKKLVKEFDRLAAKPLGYYSDTRVTFLAPVGSDQELINAGVTYQVSQEGRNLESAGEQKPKEPTIYDKVGAARRCELFRKTLALKAVGPNHPIGIRKDAKWSVPEPEVAIGFNSRREPVLHTLHNDVSSRDIEGKNPLYLPQAKDYKWSASYGPCAVLGVSEDEAKERFIIGMEIKRGGKTIFKESTPYSKMRRPYANLRRFLFRSAEFPHGVVLATGTGIIPGKGTTAKFSIEEGDVVTITVPEIGTLQNPVVRV